MQRPSAKTRRLIAASAWSLALHALVVAVVARISWKPAEREQRPVVEVVWLAELPVPDAVTAPIDPERAPEPPPEPGPSQPDSESPEPASSAEPNSPPPEPQPPSPDLEPPPEPERPPDVPPDEETSAPTAPPDEPERPSEPESATAPPPTAPSPDAPAADDSERSFVITETELEEAWRRALEEMRAQRELDENYLTFSFDDLADAVPPEGPDSPESIFEAAERYAGSGGPSLASPNRARTRVGRALAEFCNALTGGFGVALNGIGGLMTLCAERGESAKLFARIKPAYLRSRPVCTEVETGTAAEGGTPTIKCELVLEDELEQGEYELE